MEYSHDNHWRTLAIFIPKMGYSHDCQHWTNLHPHNGILSCLNGRKSRYPQWDTLMPAFKKSSYPWWDTLMFALKRSSYQWWDTFMLAFKKPLYPQWDMFMFALKWSLYPWWDILSCLNPRNVCTHDGILSCLHWRDLRTHNGILSSLHQRNLCTHKWFDSIHGNPLKNQVKAKKTRPTIRTKGEKKQHRRNRGEEKKRTTPKCYLWWDGWCVLGLRNDKPITAFVIQKRKQNGLQVFKRLLNCMYQVRIPTYPLPKFLLCTLPVLFHNVHSYVHLPKI
jgi:hypothetical protein